MADSDQKSFAVPPEPGQPPRPVLNPKRRKALAAKAAREAAEAAAAAKRRPVAVLPLVTAGVLGLVAVGTVVLLAVLSAEQSPTEPTGLARTADQIVERDNRWAEGTGRVAPEGSGLKAGHREVRTGSVQINLRTVDRAAVPGEGRPAASETGSNPAAPPPQAAAKGGAGLPSGASEPAGE